MRIRKLDGAPVANHRPSHGGAKRFADKQPTEGAAAPSEHAPRPENAPRDKKPWGKPSFKDKPPFKDKPSFRDKPSFKDKPTFKDGPASPAGAKPKKRKPRD